MTLALVGKSGRRRLLLVAVALSAPAAGMFLGLGPRSSGNAIGGDTGWKSPALDGSSVLNSSVAFNGFTNGDRAKTQDDQFASTPVHLNQHSYGSFGLQLDAEAEVTGIEVRLDGWNRVITENNCEVHVRLWRSSKGGINRWTEERTLTLPAGGDTDTYLTVGNDSDLWSEAGWAVSDFSNAQFLVDLQFFDPGPRCNSTSTTGGIAVDHIQVRVHYTTLPPPALPDLTVVKSAVRDGAPVTSIADNQDFRWRWVITNTGEGEATFSAGQVVLRDELPTGLIYSGPSSPSAELTCAVSGGVLTCTANSALTIPPQGSLVALVLATPQSAGTYTNAPSGCQVDYLAGNAAGNVAESDERNNACAEVVSVEVLPRFHPRVCVRLEDNGDAVIGQAATFQVVVTNLDTGSIVNTLNAARSEVSAVDPMTAGECADLSFFVAGTSLRITQTVLSPPEFASASGYPVVSVIPGIDPAPPVSQVDIVVGDGHCGGDTAGETVIANGTCNVHFRNRFVPAAPAPVLPTVRKEAHPEPVVEGVARWTISIDQPDENWAEQTVVVTDAHADIKLVDPHAACALENGVITCLVGETDLAVTVTRAISDSALASGTLCAGGTIENHLISANLADGTAVAVTAGLEPVGIAVSDTTTCGEPTAVKRLVDGGSDIVEEPGDVRWEVVISNPEDGLDGTHVTVRDPGAAVQSAVTTPPQKFGEWCEIVDTEALEAACVLPAGAHVSLIVSPADAPTLHCEATTYSNTAEFRIGAGDWSEAHGPDITLLGATSECPQDITIVKRLVNVPDGWQIDPATDLPALTVPDGDQLSGPVHRGSGLWEWTFTVPPHYDGEVTEAVPGGWEPVACEPEPGAYATFCNQPLATVSVRKTYITNGGPDATDDDNPYSILLEGHGAFLPAGPTVGNVTEYQEKEISSGRYTVTESLSAGWLLREITVSGRGCSEVVPTDIFDALEQTLARAIHMLSLKLAITFDAAPGAECLVTLTNERLVATVIIEKVYVGADGDEPVIALAIDGHGATGEWAKVREPATEWRQVIAVSGGGSTIEVTETLPAGWANVTARSGSCSGVDTSSAPRDGATASVSVENVIPGDTATVCFINVAVGRVQLIKLDGVPSGGTQTWTFLSDAPGVGGNMQTPDSGSASQAQATFENVPVGSYSVSEAEGRGKCLPGALSSDFQTLAAAGLGQPPGDEEMTTVVGPGPVEFEVAKGETTYIRFDNVGCGAVLGTGTIVVWKFADFDGDGLRDPAEPPVPDWPFTISGPDGTFEVQTDGDGKHVFTVAQGGTYTVSETAQAGWKVIGSRQLNTFSPGPIAQVTAGLGQHREVTFLNQPRVGVLVSKTEVSSASPAGRPGAGWQFTVTGCGIEPRAAFTGEDGTVLFADLPPAVGCSYAVVEAPRDGWFALFASRTASPSNPGEIATLGFRTTLIEGCESCVPPAVTSPPAATPVVPGATPPAPATPDTGATPTPVLTTETPGTPGPSITAIAGDRVPGASPTPLPPATGFGPEDHGSPFLLLLLGSVAVATGLMFIRAGRRR